MFPCFSSRIIQQDHLESEHFSHISCFCVRPLLNLFLPLKAQMLGRRNLPSSRPSSLFWNFGYEQLEPPFKSPTFFPFSWHAFSRPLFGTELKAHLGPTPSSDLLKFESAREPVGDLAAFSLNDWFDSSRSFLFYFGPGHPNHAFYPTLFLTLELLLQLLQNRFFPHIKWSCSTEARWENASSFLQLFPRQSPLMTILAEYAFGISLCSPLCFFFFLLLVFFFRSPPPAPIRVPSLSFPLLRPPPFASSSPF